MYLRVHLDVASETGGTDEVRTARSFGFDARVLDKHGPGGGNPLIEVSLKDNQGDEHQVMRLLGLLLLWGFEMEMVTFMGAASVIDATKVLSAQLRQIRRVEHYKSS